MTGEQLISLNLKTYLSMKKQYGKDNPDVMKLYGKLKDMIIVEIYFMQDLRMTLDVEEMSGFVLFINDDLDSIISSYRSNKGRFFPYLKESLENLAIAYLKRKNKALTMYISAWMGERVLLISHDSCRLHSTDLPMVIFMLGLLRNHLYMAMSISLTAP